MATGFIKDERLLDEKVSEKDYLDFSSSITTLSEKLSSTDGNLMIGIIGSFGIGKSTLISKTKTLRTDKNEEWIHFDAWQFPDRKELWDGLVLETAKHLSRLEEVRRKMDGQSNKDKRLAVSTTGSVIDVASSALSGIPLLLKPLFGLIKNLEYFADKSPARRVFEIQDIFASLINNIKKEKVVFILEDVDRSGEAGLFFLETFRQFLSKMELNKKVIVLVAISNTSYYKNIDSYLKCLDYVEFFNKKDGVNLANFVSEVFESDVQYEPEVLIDFINYFYTKHPDMNMRKIKLILRQANLNYVELKRAGYEPNRLICIAVVASKYVKPDPQAEASYFDSIIKTRRIVPNSEINRMILVTNNQFRSYTNEHIVTVGKKELAHTADITLVKRPKAQDVGSYPSTPYITNSWHDDDNKSKVCLPDFYFTDL
jgi:hypothetical protein